MPTPDLSPDDRRLIDSLLGRWEEAVARGETPRPETICPDRPDLWQALVARAAQLASMAFLDGEERPVVSPGQRLNGRFRLIEPLAAGGHAEVWRAHDENLRRDVAVKLISIGPLAAPQRLIDEGLRLASLDHPHIVRVLDAGIEDGIAFLVQALVTGETLAERIASGPLPEKRILAWISEVAEALEAAHDLPAGMIHRDVKPANILIDGHGNALLADFGIALPIGEAASGTSAGTLPYKSPEQLDGRPLDRRSDVFSLALVLYEVFTGTLPYSAHDADTIRREMREPLAGRIARLPAPRSLPDRFLPLLERALAVHPDARPRHARAFREELALAAAGSRSPGRGRRLAIAGVCAVLALAALATALARRARLAAARPDNALPMNLGKADEALQAVNQAITVINQARGGVPDLRSLDKALSSVHQDDPFYASWDRARDAEDAEKKGRLAEALALYTEAIAIKPDNAWFYVHRARIHRKLGDPAKESADLSEAQRLRPNDAFIKRQRGKDDRAAGFIPPQLRPDDESTSGRP